MDPKEQTIVCQYKCEKKKKAVTFPEHLVHAGHNARCLTGLIPWNPLTNPNKSRAFHYTDEKVTILHMRKLRHGEIK